MKAEEIFANLSWDDRCLMPQQNNIQDKEITSHKHKC